MDVFKIVLLGDKDHGKSTFIGSTLLLTKSVSNARISEAKKISEELGRPFEPGFLMDSFSEERQDAMTIDTTRAQLEYKNRGFEFIDVPGHEELISNMLTGASNASTAVLIVSAKNGEGISEQTKRHLLLSKMLGISSVLVCVNKMDSVGYSQKRFNEIKKELSGFIKNAEKSIGSIKASFVPISAYTGENIITKSKKMKWYNGHPLFSLLYSSIGKDLRSRSNPNKSLVVVQGLLDGGNVACKVISGKIRKGQAMHVASTSKEVFVHAIFKAGKKSQHAEANTSPVIDFGNIEGMERGSIIYSGKPPIISKNINALIFTVEKPSNALVRIGVKEVECSIRSFGMIDIATGKIKQEKKIEPLNIYKVEIEAKSKMVFEKFEDTAELGRFTIRSGGKFSGVGIIV
ncbi:MAG: GTP-binding protein [Candidatus Micrarchaeia archaeon]